MQADAAVEEIVGDDESVGIEEPGGSLPPAADGGTARATDPTKSPVTSSEGDSSGLRHRVLDDLKREAAAGVAAGGRTAAQLGHAAQAMTLEIVPTGFDGERALKGHVLGMHLVVPASHLHGPREAPALIYLFADALAVRPTDDAPMSTIPLFGLHLVLPPVAVARWAYKAGRIEHANLDLVKDAQRFADSLAAWTVEDFADADQKLEVHRATELTGPIHVYEHMGFANVSVPSPGRRPVHLKSALPVSSDAFVKLWQLFALVSWPRGLSAEVTEEVRAEPGGGRSSTGMGAGQASDLGPEPPP
ncbi:MAG TPA: hypothetical protein VMD28_03215 [Acidimicrobiales bacterium]|nr:hypothetical protein [Acidimicrobiales bacterium]